MDLQYNQSRNTNNTNIGSPVSPYAVNITGLQTFSRNTSVADDVENQGAVVPALVNRHSGGRGTSLGKSPDNDLAVVSNPLNDKPRSTNEDL